MRCEKIKAVLDATDLAILSNLQHDSRQTVSEISEKVHLSKSACHRRIKAMEGAGIICGYVARLSHKKLGYSVEFFVELTLATQVENAFERFEKAVHMVPQVVECCLVGGRYDYLLRVLAEDAEDYERIHREAISRLPGVTRIESMLSLRKVKADKGLPL